MNNLEKDSKRQTERKRESGNQNKCEREMQREIDNDDRNLILDLVWIHPYQHL